MMEGASLSPTVHVYPAVPATVAIEVSYYPNSDTTRKKVWKATGTANRFGYFHPAPTSADGSPLTFDEPGEYRVDVTANYEDKDGNLWMASRSGASVVANPESKLTMHGGSVVLGQPWFFNREAAGCTESCDGTVVNLFPMFRGDVVWFAEPLNLQRPDMYISDPQGLTTEKTEPGESRSLRSRGTPGYDVLQYPEKITVNEYWYESVQRPGESVQARALRDGSHHSHWYTNDNYNAQLGMGPEGDRPNDIKLLFGGAVHRGPQGNVYGYYGAMDAIIPEDTSLGQRTCAPFQGAAGGPSNCGPLLTINGRDADLFLTPTGVKPGTILEVGDTFAFSGQMWPTLASNYTVTVTKPDGSLVNWQGKASPIGYVESKEHTFTVTQAGRYRVHVALRHDSVLPSTGLAPTTPIIADGKTVLTALGYTKALSAIMGSDDSSFDVYVVDKASAAVVVAVRIDQANPGPSSLVEIEVETAVTTSDSAHYTIAMPGLLLGQGTASIKSGKLRFSVDRRSLAVTHPNFEPAYEVYSASILVKTATGYIAQQLRFRGNDVFSVSDDGAPSHLVCGREMNATETPRER